VVLKTGETEEKTVVWTNLCGLARAEKRKENSMTLSFKQASQRTVVPSVLMAVALVILALGLWPAAASANPQAVVRPDPLSLGLRSGGEGSLSIRVDNVESMYGLEVHLTFDPNVVQVVDSDPSKAGVQLKPGDWLKGGFIAVNKADNAKGTIDYAITLLNPAPPVSGSGVVATITFQAKNSGTSPLKIIKAILATREAKEIQSELQDGAIGVSASGQAPVVQQPKGNNAQPSSGASAPNPSSALPVPEILLVGVAGVGVLAFLGALLFVGAILVFRRRT
jgi:Cohesin domain